jgi:hypothetical protein
MALLLILGLTVVPVLSTAAPPDCRREPLTDADYLALQESFMADVRKEEVLLPSPNPSISVAGGYTADVKAMTVAPIGVEIVEPPGCPDLSDQ